METRCKYCGKVIDKDLWCEEQASGETNGFFCEDAPHDSMWVDCFNSGVWRPHKRETKLDRLTKFYDQARKTATGR